ncbi:MAG: hypothetical protein PHZ00_07675, partial [Candidatus Peribacteraceae bacterium]|nr:hypothetical protein [Candidatus Peribacteraceae bacterium]
MVRPGSPENGGETQSRSKPDVPSQRSVASVRAPEMKPPYETVPEAPGLRRQMFFASPFNVYADVMDAGDMVPVKGTIRNVPAVYTILEAPENLRGRIMQIGDEEGNPVGWINVRESRGAEWNIQRAFVPHFRDAPSGVLQLHDRPESGADHMDMSVPSSTVFPVTEVATG